MAAEGVSIEVLDAKRSAADARRVGFERVSHAGGEVVCSRSRHGAVTVPGDAAEQACALAQLIEDVAISGLLVDKDLCIGCGLCVKACGNAGIVVEGERPNRRLACAPPNRRTPMRRVRAGMPQEGDFHARDEDGDETPQQRASRLAAYRMFGCSRRSTRRAARFPWRSNCWAAPASSRLFAAAVLSPCWARAPPPRKTRLPRCSRRVRTRFCCAATTVWQPWMRGSTRIGSAIWRASASRRSSCTAPPHFNEASSRRAWPSGCKRALPRTARFSTSIPPRACCSRRALLLAVTSWPLSNARGIAPRWPPFVRASSLLPKRTPCNAERGRITQVALADAWQPSVRVDVIEHAGATDVITDADVLVVAGRGIGSKKNLAVAQRLADALGGKLGCTRPLVESGWLEYWHQVGQTGVSVSPKLLISLGVSGAIQHLWRERAARRP